MGKDDLYLQLDMENTTIESIPEGTLTGSGSDGSGPGSSYANGSLVRGKKIIPGSTSCDTEDTIDTSSTNIYGNGTTSFDLTTTSTNTSY